MKSAKPALFVLAGFLFGSIFAFGACGKKNTTEPDHAHGVEVMMSYTPNPATANTAIAFLFETEENGTHVAVSGIDVEVEKEGTGVHVEIVVTPEAGETGHYVGTHTFSEAGNYELHFKGTHDGEAFEHKFTIVVM